MFKGLLRPENIFHYMTETRKGIKGAIEQNSMRSSSPNRHRGREVAQHINSLAQPQQQTLWGIFGMRELSDRVASYQKYLKVVTLLLEE